MEPLIPVPERFSLRYGFFIVMGGCIDKSIQTGRHTYATLTAKGILKLAEQGHFVEIPSETISGKSKANVLEKTLVCVQVL